MKFNFPFLCALIYRPPKFNKDFIKDFTDFLTEISFNYDRFLIVGDFNIHVCCESKPLVNEFLSLIDSFNLTQSVNVPTHEKGHTLDLVLSYGLDLSDFDIYKPRISDHFAVLFTVTLPSSHVKPCPWLYVCAL